MVGWQSLFLAQEHLIVSVSSCEILKIEIMLFIMREVSAPAHKVTPTLQSEISHSDNRY